MPCLHPGAWRGSSEKGQPAPNVNFPSSPPRPIRQTTPSLSSSTSPGAHPSAGERKRHCDSRQRGLAWPQRRGTDEPRASSRDGRGDARQGDRADRRGEPAGLAPKTPAHGRCTQNTNNGTPITSIAACVPNNQERIHAFGWDFCLFSPRILLIIHQNL